MSYCYRHPDRPMVCRCRGACEECRALSEIGCVCRNHCDPPPQRCNTPEPIPDDLRPPKLIRQTGMMNLMPEPQPAPERRIQIDLSSIDNALSELQRSQQEKDKQTSLMVEKLSARYRKQLEDERLAFEARKHELEQTIAMVEIEKQELEQELQSRERSKSAVRDIEEKIADNKKKLRKALKQRKAETEADKWRRLSRGGSSQNITAH